MNSVVKGLDRVNDEHLRYNSDELNERYFKQRKKIKDFYKKSGPNITYEMVVDNKDLNQPLEQRSLQRKERINELNAYLSQPIVMNKNHNPYYDNSFHTDKDNSSESSDRIFKKYMQNGDNVDFREQSAKRQEFMKRRFEVLTTPENEHVDDKKILEESEKNNFVYIERPESYNQGLRRYGQDGEFLKKRFKEEEDNLKDYLENQIRIKKMKEEQEKERIKREEEYLDRKNKEYYLEKEREDLYGDGDHFEDSLDRLQGESHLEGPSPKNLRIENLSSLYPSGDITPRHFIEEDEIVMNPRNNDDKLLLHSNSTLVPLDGETSRTERKYESIESLKARNIETMLKVRQEARDMFFEINKLTHNRYKLQAQASESKISHQRAMNDFRNLSEKLMKERVEIGIDLAKENLKNMRFGEFKEDDGDKKRLEYEKNRRNKFRDLKLYLVQNSILRQGENNNNNGLKGF